MNTIWIKTSLIGFHRWPNAPKEVSYLAQPHRHVFNVKVEVPVAHSNRDVEFHSLKQVADHQLKRLASKMTLEKQSTLSCEQIAEHLYNRLAVLDYNPICVEVDEDGECGATFQVI